MKEPTDRERHPAAAAPYKVASRSCNACYQRKVKCDRGVPCTNCEKHGSNCVYPTKPQPDADGGVPTRKGPSLQSISSRLERVEELLTRLVDRTDVPQKPTSSSSSCLPSRPQNPRRGSHPVDLRPQLPPRTQDAQGQQNQPSTTWEILLNDEQDERALPFAATPSSTNTPRSPGLHRPVGTSTNTPASHYQYNHDGTPASSGNDILQPTKDVSTTSTHNVDVLSLYPDTQLALQLWSTYVKHVDPVLKILHIPSLQSVVVQTILDPKSATTSTLSLTFAIYYAAVTSMCPDDSAPIPTEERKTLLYRFRTALDQLLAVSNLVNRPDIPSIQALAIYVVSCLVLHMPPSFV